MNNIKFESSYWTDTELVEPNHLSKEAKFMKIAEEEYFIANINLQNRGSLLLDVNSTITFFYSGLIVESQVQLGDWVTSSNKEFMVGNLPVPEIMDWSNASAILTWSIGNMEKINLVSLKIPIVPKTRNYDAPVVTNLSNSDDDHDHSQLQLNTHVVDVLEIWEGSEYSKSSLAKGQGPTAYFRIKFNSAVTGGFYAQYTMKGVTHNGWTTSYTTFWSGNFNAGSTWVFSFTFGWNFDNSKYVFGQGEYQFYSLKAYTTPSIYDTEYNDGTTDDFSISEWSSGDHVVFLGVIYDSYLTSNHNCLDRSASQYISDAVADFESVFAINYLTTIKQTNWLGAHGEWYRVGISLCGGVGTVNVADESNSGLRTTSINGLQTAYGLSGQWDDSSSGTRKSNHGFDQAIALTGLMRSYNSNHGDTVGQAGTPGNHGWAVAGLEYGYPPFLAWTAVGDSAYDNLVQHEMSHNWGAEHDNSNNNVMKEDTCNCSNWNSQAQGEFDLTQFDSVPTG